jgi:hypothetical protein
VVGGGLREGDGVVGLGEGVGVVWGGLGEGEGVVVGGVYVDVGGAELGGAGLPINVTIVAIPVPLDTLKVQTLSGQHVHGE